ncbi:HYR-like domain-containing protein, partial [Winogradskyella wichelsiae]|uniref:HYR-like domain-containing protein n=1 Tax=Winogradskyella wichelsiae TaxID=2697007 RepID=UPI003EFAF8F0
TTNTSILSGDIGTLTDISDNTYHVVISSGDVGSALLNGFKVTAGNASGSSSIQVNNSIIYISSGGGIYNNNNNNNSSPSLTNVTITRNTARNGGGIYNWSSSPSLINVAITENTASSGGGIYNNFYSSPSLTNVAITENTASNNGGGIYNFYSSPSFTNVAITGNTAVYNGGGIFNNTYSSPSFTNVAITGNTAVYNGGGILNYTYSSPSFTDVAITDNTANNDGGGIYNYDNSSPSLTNVAITGNTAVYNGGGIYNWSSSPSFTNVAITENTASGGDGGGIYNYDNSSPSLTNTTVVGAIYNTVNGSVTLNSSIVWGGITGGYIANYSLIKDNSSTVNNNIDATALTDTDIFTDPSNGDYSLKDSSVAINAGNNASYTTAGGDLANDLDLAGNARLFGAIIDLGAYEVQNTAPTASCQNVTVYLDENGSVSISSSGIDNGSSDSESTVSLSLDVTAFDCDDLGDNTVTLTVTDTAGATATCTAIVTVSDNIAPVADATSLAAITAECEILATDITEPAATDNCGGTVTVTNDATFPISTQGTTVITWTYEDVNGNTATQTQNVVINDVTAPVADATSLAAITAECEILATDITEPAATDNCGGTVTVTNDATFPISTQGTTVITWTYEDVNGNTATQTQNVVINDVTAPVADATSLAAITAECEVLATDITEPTATDNCGGTVTVTNDATFPITAQGTTVITWTYEDVNGNTATQTQNIVIDDVTAPVADATSLAAITAECEILATDITEPAATDNCGGTVTVTNDATFPITAQGTTVIIWTYEDMNGNTATQTQNIVIDDATAPVADTASLAAITAECEVLATDITEPAATDNCGGTVTVTNNATFPITAQGTTVITWTYEDVNGNTATQTQDVVINDVSAPVADVTSLAAITAECEVLATDITEPTATDNCSGTVTVTNDATFPITAQGTTVITWTYEDVNGNTATQTQDVVIEDISGPIPDVANLTAITMACEVLATDVTAPTATDNCGVTVTVTNDATFPILTPGITVITWTYTDVNGNSSTQTQNINVLDSPISEVTFNDDTVTYDGSLHSLVVNNLPTDASVSYAITPTANTANGAIEAGVYTVTAIVTPPITAVNCDIITLTATLTIEQAMQIITFNPLAIMMLEDDPDFQLLATASSGLEVDYTYTFTVANPPATVTSAGWVALLTSGFVDITAHQAGNANYLPATSVMQTLQINSRDAAAHSVTIENEVYNNPTNEIYYLMACEAALDAVTVTFETETNANVNPSHQFSIATPAPGIYEQEVVITSQDGSTTETYIVIIEKMFPFFDIVEQKFDNVLLVNNNSENNGGYRFVAYEWFKDGQFIGNEQYYSAGPSSTDLLDPNAEYYVRMETEEGDILQTCMANITLEHDFSASIYPNPNVSGRVLNIDMEGFKISSKAQVNIVLYSMQGAKVSQWVSSTNLTTINLPRTLDAGAYIVNCTVGTMTRNFKLIIK